MSYGVNAIDPFRRASEYVSRILRGADPTDPSRSGADEIRTRDQSRDGKGSRPDRARQAARCRRRGDRVNGWRNSAGVNCYLPSAHLVFNFRDPAPPSPRGVLANATPRRFPLRLTTKQPQSEVSWRSRANEATRVHHASQRRGRDRADAIPISLARTYSQRIWFFLPGAGAGDRKSVV